MFQKAELERLRQQKDLLVLQSDVHRRLLAAELQRLRSPETWMSEAGHLVRRHPVLTAALASAAGVLAVKAVRNPSSIVGGMGRLGELAAAAFSLWKLIRREKSEE
jgi:hypothetical protein